MSLLFWQASKEQRVFRWRMRYSGHNLQLPRWKVHDPGGTTAATLVDTTCSEIGGRESVLQRRSIKRPPGGPKRSKWPSRFYDPSQPVTSTAETGMTAKKQSCSAYAPARKRNNKKRANTRNTRPPKRDQCLISAQAAKLRR